MPHEAKQILITLKENGYQAYVVGGYVRDFLLGIESKDIDICTNAPVSELEKIFYRKGNPYGVFTIKEKDFSIEITSFRKEIEYKNRKPQILYTSHLKEDLKRRDFTINAICMNEKEEIIDLLNGRNDLEKKYLCCIGDCQKKLKEDPLRILRAIRFSTLLNFTMEKNLEKEIRKQAYLIETLSTFRYKQEIEQILISPNYQKGLDLLKKYHLAEKMGLYFSKITKTKSILGMWAQIKYKKNYPFTKKEKKHIVDIQAIVKKRKIDCFILYQYGLEKSLIASEIMKISKKNIFKIYNAMPIHCFKEIDFSINEFPFSNFEKKKMQKIKKEIEKAILLKKVLNKQSLLERYIIENKERWLS